MNAGEWDIAIRELDAAIALDDDFAWPFYARAYCRFKLALREDALPDLKRAIRLKPKDIEAIYLRAMVNADLGRLSEAISDYTLVIELDPSHGRAYLSRGVHKLALDFDANKRSASQDFQRALELGEPEAQDWLSKCCD